MNPRLFVSFFAVASIALYALPASASVSDLEISFCDSGSPSKRLDLTVAQLPWHHVSCIRYSNLGTDTVSASLGVSDGFTLADGKIGCADDSADTGAFAAFVRYGWADASISLEPGQSVEREVVFDVASMPDAPVSGCLVTAPVRSASTGGIDVVVRRANIVTLSRSASLPSSRANSTAGTGSVAASTGSSVVEAASESATATGTSDVRAGVSPVFSPDSIAPVDEIVPAPDAPVVKERAPEHLSFLASARQITVPVWLAAVLMLAAFVAGLLVFRLRPAPAPEKSE